MKTMNALKELEDKKIEYENIEALNFHTEQVTLKRLSELPEFETIEELNNLYKTGDKIKFAEEKRPYKIRACNERFLVCTKPFNPKHTVMYTIVDLKENVRGTESLIFCMGFETDEECKEALERLISGETEVSYRNRIQLNIVNNG